MGLADRHVLVELTALAALASLTLELGLGRDQLLHAVDDLLGVALNRGAKLLAARDVVDQADGHTRTVR